MKKPNVHDLASLAKAPVTDPVITANPAPTRPASTTISRPGQTRTKIAVYMEQSEAERTRAAYNALPATSRPPSFSQWLATIIAQAVDQTEKTTGPLHGIPAGQLRKGRPLNP
ncbi:Uncharacterised protein [Actinobaculum suis]|uniref:Centromere-binding protein ParB C-terminal domain-containing protein n=1 Tax=Actinobaculum suis TaxID=1657 RepID=A0A7Z9C7Z6_9ACTO|nr:hypothetical protein [Actinobaculum suis]VDG75798.1 Uncharacterised protein [Actinobaculum suis]